MHRTRLIAFAAVSMGLAACEKPASPENTVSNSAMTADQAAAAGAGQLVASPLPAQPVVSEPVFGPDFVATVGSANLFEIAEAKLAEVRSTNASVKAFAADMIDAHTKSNAALAAAVTAAGQTTELPTTLPDAMQVKVTVLGQTAGNAFDTIYLSDQVAAHEAAVTALTVYARRGDVPALKAFAEAATKTVEDHLAQARALEATTR